MPEKIGNSINLGFKNKLRQIPDKLHGHMDAAEYKHVVLALIFLRGIAGFVMTNDFLSTSTKAELAIRKGIIEDDLVDCFGALVAQLLYTTQTCLLMVLEP